MNEFVARNGLIALDSSSISGPLTVNNRADIFGQFYINNGGSIGQVIQAVNHVGGTSYIYLQAGGSDSYISSTGTNSFNIVNTARIGLGSSNSVPWLGMTSTGTYIGFNSHVSPSARLHIKGATTGSALTLLTQNSNDSASFAVKDDGNIGIGTTSPTARLDVRGNTFLSGSVTGSDMLIRGSGGTSGTNALTLLNSAGSSLLIVRNNGTSVFGNQITVVGGTSGGLTNSSAGDVKLWLFGNYGVVMNLSNSANSTSGHAITGTSRDVGTYTAPKSLISIYQDVYAAVTASTQNQHLMTIGGTANFVSMSAVSYNYMNLVPTVTNIVGTTNIARGLYINPTLSASIQDWRSIEWSNNYGWGLYGSGSANNYLAGNLGIGTISPSAKLDVRGNISSSGNFTIGGNIYKSVDNSNLGLYGGYSNPTSGGFIKIHGQSNLWGQVQINIGYEPDNSKGIWTLNDSTQLMTLTGRGRLGIGTTSPTATLDVRGNTFLSGSVTSSGTIVARGGISVEGSLSMNTLNAGFQAGGPITFLSSNGSITATNVLTINGANATNLTNSAIGVIQVSKTANITSTSGDIYWIDVNTNTARSFVPTSGSATMTMINITPIINQTGGANGVTRGLYVNPTITAAADFRSIEWSTNAATSPSASWGLYGAGTAPNYIAGNLLVGTTSNTGEKLQVGGTMKVTGYATFGSAGFALVFDGNGVRTDRAPFGIVRDGVNYNFYVSPIFGQNTFGTHNVISTPTNYQPTSGTAVFNTFVVNTTVSQSGGANGITRGVYVNPTLTAAADWRSIEWSNNAATAPSASWGLYGAGTAPNYINGNLLVGTTSNTGEKLNVGGNVNVSGNVKIVGSLFINIPTIFPSADLGNSINTGSGGLFIGYNSGPTYTGVPIVTLGKPITFSNTHTSGEMQMVVSAGSFAPTSGTGTFVHHAIRGTINQTGGANGITRGLYIIPTLTRAADWRSIEWSNNAATAPSASWGLYGAGTAPNYLAGNLGIGTTSPTYRLDINGSFRSSGSITATSGSDYFDISHDLTQPAQTGSQIYEVNITPTLRYTAPNQTQTALRVAATFSGSTALSSSQSNIIADFGSTSAGSQFLVNDVTSGSIYMVNDVSGLPIIEANSNWDVMIYDYPNVVLRKTGSAIIISGSLTIASGSDGDLYMYGHKMFSVGAFQSDQTQSGSANVSQSITYNATDYSQGVSVVSGSRLTVANAGVYNIQFSVQIDRTSGSGVDTIHIWLKKNGTNVTNSSGTITISGNATQAKTISSWNYVVDSVANDYYELCWQTSNTDIQLINVAATGNIPGTPSVIVTVTQVR
jgi:hypothetical protein